MSHNKSGSLLSQRPSPLFAPTQPTAVKGVIFCFIDATQLYVCGSVCREWNRLLSSDNLIWRSVFLDRWGAERSRYRYDHELSSSSSSQSSSTIAITAPASKNTSAVNTNKPQIAAAATTSTSTQSSSQKPSPSSTSQCVSPPAQRTWKEAFKLMEQSKRSALRGKRFDYCGIWKSLESSTLNLPRTRSLTPHASHVV